MAWLNSFFRHQSNHNGKRKKAALAIERLEERTVPTGTGGLVNVGELVAPDTNVKSLYEMALDPTTGKGYWGTDSSSPGAIVKVDLTGSLPVIVSENTTGIGGSRAGFVAGVVDTTNPDPSLHYLYVAQNGFIVKYSPGVGSQAPAPIAQLAIPDGGSIGNAVVDGTTGYAYFGAQASGQSFVIRLRLSDFTLQGVEWIGTLPNSANLGQNAVIDTTHHTLYFASNGLHPSLEKVNVSSFTDGATNVGTYFDLGASIDAVDSHYAGIMPNSYGANLIFDQAHNLLYFGTYSFDGSTGQVNNNVWPYNQATVVRIDPTGGGAGFASSVVSTLDLQPGERNLSVAGFDQADGDIIYATDNTYPMHVYRIHVGDGSQPMQEVGALQLNGGSQPPFVDGVSHPESTAATQGEVFARSACFYNGNLYIGTDTPPGQFIKIGVTGVAAAPSANAVFVNNLYEDYLKRAADLANPYGAGSWVNYLNSNAMTPATVAYDIIHSAEALGRVVDGLYLKLLGRPSDPGGRAGFVGFLQRGGTVEQAITVIDTSSEFNALAGTSSGYIQALYTRLLGRSANSGEVAAWLSLLPSMGETGIANAFVNSTEFRGDIIEKLYGTSLPAVSVASIFPDLLLRPLPPSAAEVNGWANSTFDIFTLNVDFAGSGEFFKNG